VDNSVDNCGLFSSLRWITMGASNAKRSDLWIIVDDLWKNLYGFIRGNVTLSTIHRPITIKDFLYTFNNLGGTK